MEVVFQLPCPFHFPLQESVLSQGYRYRRSGTNNGVTGVPVLENYYPNTIVATLCRPEWQALLARTGAPPVSFPCDIAFSCVFNRKRPSWREPTTLPVIMTCELILHVDPHT